jgi:hypothetical protein
MGADFQTIAIVAFYILAMVLGFILSARIRRGFRDLSKFLQEDWPEKWLEVSSDAVILAVINQNLFNFIWRGKIFRSARIALAVKQLRENYTAFFVVFFVILSVSCRLFFLPISRV